MAEDAAAAVSDSAGFFSVGDRQAGERLDLRADMPGYATGAAIGVEAPTHRPIEIELQPASRVRGQVIDATGRPVAGATVQASLTIISAQAGIARQPDSATSDEEGAFVIDEIGPGEIELSTKADGYATNEIKSLIVEPGRDLEGVTIVMAPGASISGRVTDPSGNPVVAGHLMAQGATISFRSSQHAFARTDGEGRYRLEGVPPGRYSVTAQHDEYQ